MAINVSVQYNSGLLPDIILSTQYYYHRRIRLNAIKRFCLSLQPMIPPKRFDTFPLTGGCSEGLGAFRLFFKQSTPYAIYRMFQNNSQFVFTQILFYGKA